MKLYLITLGAIAIGIISIWICFYVAIQRTNDAQSSWKNYIIVALLQEAILNPIIYHFVHLTISKLVKTPDQKKQHIKIAPQDDTSRNVKQDEVTVTHMESVLNLKSTTETPSGNPIQN